MSNKSDRAKSEMLFEEACIAFGIVIQREPEDSSKSPDYRIQLGGYLVFAEVKQMDENDEDKRVLEEARRTGSSASWPNSAGRIRRKIKKANAQLKQRTRDEHAGVLVLYSNTCVGDYDPQDMHDAMFGTEAYTFLVARDGSHEHIDLGPTLSSDRLLTAKKHTSTSAIFSLRSSGSGEFALTLYHNKFAKVPIDPDWLRGKSIWHLASQEGLRMALASWVHI